MAEFQWLQGPPYGVCFGCGTSADDRGFVQTFTDVDVKQNSEIVGVADVFFCGNCLHSMGRLVGMATPQETEDFALREFDLVTELEKAKDEIQAWQQRFVTMSNLNAEDFEVLAAVEAVNGTSSTESDS